MDEISAMYEALDNMDDYALLANVKPIGPHKVLTDAIAELETLRQRAAELEKQRDELLAAIGTQSAKDVIAERQRQKEVKGWTHENDDQHKYSELSTAAGCYAMFGTSHGISSPPKFWPWPSEVWKPSGKRRNLVKAGALILAEIERLDRAAIATVKEK